MIHSLSGGVISDSGIYTFVKVELDGVPRWFVSPVPVAVGNSVVVPFGAFGEKAVKVIKVENCTSHTAPVPLSRVQEILRVV